jgi:hypothetical protein
MPSSSARVRRGGRRRRRRDATRLWAELPLDAISAIFHKLDHIEILMRASQVCRSWRSAARDEPELWRRIDMPHHPELYKANLLWMARAAVLRSKGQCEAFRASTAATIT